MPESRTVYAVSSGQGSEYRVIADFTTPEGRDLFLSEYRKGDPGSRSEDFPFGLPRVMGMVAAGTPPCAPAGIAQVAAYLPQPSPETALRLLPTCPLETELRRMGLVDRLIAAERNEESTCSTSSAE